MGPRSTSLLALLLLSPACSHSSGAGGLGLAASARRGEAQMSVESVALERSLAAVDIEQLRSDLSFLASDDFAGRDTPSPELQRAARFLAQRVEQLGLTPAALDAHGQPSYFYTFPMSWTRLDAGESRVDFRGAVAEGRLEFGSDYYLYRLGDVFDCTTKGAVVCVGSGSSADLKELDASGRWALAYERTTLSTRARERIEASGAIGLIVTPSTGFRGREYPERFERSAQTMLAGVGGSARPPRLERAPEKPFPTLYLTREATQRLLSAAGRAPDEELAAGAQLELELHERRRLTHPGGRLLLEDVCALVPGTDPVLREQVIVVSAHYDHVGTRGDLIFNGADDNASGTSGLLSLAAALQARGGLRRSVLLLWVSGEEKGLWGSEAWARAPQLPAGHYPVADINIDMIGRNAPDDLTATPSPNMGEQYNGLGRLAKQLAPLEGFRRLRSADEYWERSDHVNFARYLKLPVCFLFADIHADYHKPTDTADKIDYDKVRRVVRLVLRMLDALQTDELDLGLDSVPDEQGFRQHELVGRAQREMGELGRALEAWSQAHAGAWPKSLEELRAGAADETRFWGGELPLDPWGGAFVYAPAGAGVSLMCLGADKAAGGEGAAADFCIESGR